MTLTERDKKLLVFLGIFVVFVLLGWLGIRPMMKTITAAKDELAQAEQVKIEMEEKIQLLPSKQAMKISLEERLAEKSSTFYPVMQSQQIDKLITNLALTYSLEAKNLNIIMPQKYLSSAPYTYSDAHQAQSTASEMMGVYAPDVHFEMGGSRENLEAFIDTLINDYPSIRITGYSWINSTARRSNYDYLLKLDIQMYMFTGNGTVQE